MWSPSSIANMRDNMRDKLRKSASKVPPDLRRALTLLNFKSMSDLEDRFLATTAFLTPWSAFRDACLLIDNSNPSKTSAVTRLDILWFYTQFDENVRRHDSRVEQSDAEIEIDKSEWVYMDHEKHLYAWLLQNFRVGKAYNPFGLQYFELRNICTAWEEVFVPIVKAVRESYSVKGRRHYGRLALFIEERCPSRLAFPEGNVSMPSGVIDSPTPFRLISRPTGVRGASQTVLTQKNYDEAEKELRDVYPQYGGLVERPRFRQKMDEWLEVQRTRAAHRKTVAKPEVVQYVHKYRPQIVQQGQSKNDEPTTKPPSTNERSRSPIKRYSDGIRRSLSMNIASSRSERSEPQSPLSPVRSKTPDTPRVPVIPYGLYSYVPKVSKEEPKSPLHGVTRQIYIPDDESDRNSQLSHETDIARNTLPHNHGAPSQPKSSKEQQLEQRVNSPFRGSSSSTQTLNIDESSNGRLSDHVWSPMGAPSAVPPPLKHLPGRYDEPMPGSLLETRKLHSVVRHPSYEGNDYREEIRLSTLHSRKVSADSHSTNGALMHPKSRSRLPTPIQIPPPFVSDIRVASSDTYRAGNVPQIRDVSQTRSPPKPVPRPGNEENMTQPAHAVSALVPPIPAKSPERWLSKRDQRSEQLPRQRAFDRDPESHEMLRIVSKENIRAAVGNLTPESSTEDLRAQAARRVPTRIARPPRLETYNTHMFPRKDSRPH